MSENSADKPTFETTGDNPFESHENLVKKGDFFDIREKIPQLQDICIGSGWDQKMFEDQPIDIDLSCFLLNKIEQTRDDEDFVFYNNETSCAGGVRHLGDSRTGAGDGDDEKIQIDLNSLSFDIIKVVFTLSKYNAAERSHDFGKIRNMYLRVVNSEDDSEMFRFYMPESEYQGAIGIKVGELVREGPKWYFSVIGQPITGGLAKIATEYGIVIADI